MVEDREFPESKPTLNPSMIGLAAPKDRLAAYILDCLLLLPLIQILQAPFKKWILESLIFEETSFLSVYRFFNLSIFISLFVVYYTLMIWWRGQTLGKMFFRVKVISYHGHIDFNSSLSRALFMFFEMLFFGLSYLSVFIHPLRRPLHDRVADTLVISEKSPAGFPNPQEKWRASVFRMALSFLFLLSGGVYSLITSLQEDSEVVSLLEECKQNLPMEQASSEQLIEMHMVQKVSETCFSELVKEQLWENSSPMTLFAMSVVERADQEASRSYLKQICQENSNHHLCDVSRWMNSEQTEENLDSLVQKISQKKMASFVRLLVAPLLIAQKQYDNAQKLLDPIAQSGSLRPIVASMTFHNLVAQLKWDEAYWVYKTHDEVSDANVLMFMQLELVHPRLSTRQQIQLLDFFYPTLSERGSGRQPASVYKIPLEIRDIYRILEGRL